MDSPGQRRGSCGHKMAGFDMHEKCARCRDKGLGKDPCIVGGAICKICDNLPVGRLAREMTPVSPLKPLVKFARLSQMSNYRKSKTGNGI